MTTGDGNAAPEEAPYRGVTEPMAPALMRMNHEWAVEQILHQLHAEGFSDIRPGHMALIGFPGPHRARPSEIAARTGRSKQHVNILLGELEAAGYLERRAEGDDQRARVVNLTDRGMELAAAVKAAVENVEAHWLEVLGERRMAALKDSLWRLRAAGSQASTTLSPRTSRSTDVEPVHPDPSPRRPRLKPPREPARPANQNPRSS